MLLLYRKWKKYNEIQLTKNKIDLNNQNFTNHPPSHIVDFKQNSNLLYKTETSHISESIFFPSL